MARILIIEDDLEISGLLSEFLLENGYQASCLYIMGCMFLRFYRNTGRIWFFLISCCPTAAVIRY